MYTIISIDGGGMQGIVPAVILQYIEARIQQLADDDSFRLAQCTDFFAGTSTGGIISLILTAPGDNGVPKYSASEIIDMYVNEGATIFDTNLWRQLSTGFGIRNPKYSASGLQKSMETYFGDLKLSSALKPTLVTAYDMRSKKVKYFRSHSARLNDQDNFFSRDVAVATSSAPTYFPAADISSVTGEQFLCVDGVLFAFNPALVAYAEFRRLVQKAKARNMFLLSFSTGYQPLDIDSDEVKNWGSLEWLTQFMDVMSDSVRQDVNNQLQQVFAGSPDNYIRINPQLPIQPKLDMDCATPENIEYLKSIAHNYIEENSTWLNTIADRLFRYSFGDECRVFYKGLGLKVDPVWRQQYPQDVPPEIDPDRYNDLVEMMDLAADKYIDRIAYESSGTCLTYREVKQYSNELAYWLQSQSLKPQDTVAIMLPNCLCYPIIFQAILKAGMIAVTINPLYLSRELEHIIADSNCKTLFIWEGVVNVFEGCSNKDQVQRVLACSIADFFPSPKRELFQLVSKHIKKKVPVFDLSPYHSLHKIMARCKGHRPLGVTLTNTDIALLQYTGGTTGVSKGAMLTHRNMIANVLQTETMMAPEIKASEQPRKIITALPLYHIFALMVNKIFMYILGAHNILITNARDIDGFIDTLKKQPIHFITGVNTLYNALLYHPRFSEVDWSEMSMSLAGGMAARPDTAEKWHQATGSVLTEGYGLTETSPVVSVNGYWNESFSGNVGFPVPSTLVMIANKWGHSLPQGEVGEICVQGPQVMKGYWNKTADVYADMADDLWFRTGDMGRFDEKGQLFIVDRLKDMINVSGFNVYPNELEEVIDKHPQVVESACIGVEDDKQGERVKAYVVLIEGSQLSSQEILDWCSTQLTSYKIPSEVEFIETLPKSNVGKILRKDLKNPPQGNTE